MGEACAHGQQCLLQRKTWETAAASSHVGLTLIKWVTRWLLDMRLLRGVVKGQGPPDLTSTGLSSTIPSPTKLS